MKSIRIEIILFVSLVTLFTSGLMLAVSIHNIQDAYEQTTLSSLNVLVKNVADNISSKLECELIRTETIANRPSIRKSGTSVYDKAISLAQEVKPEQQHRYFIIVDKKGQGFSSEGKPVNIADRVYFKQAIQGKPVISDPIKINC